MLRTDWAFCYKSEFFRLLDEKCVPLKPVAFHLKYIQDVFALSEVRATAKSFASESGISIGEIGADRSRVLPNLIDDKIKLFAIDVYDREIGGGSTDKPSHTGYEIIECLVGDSKSCIGDEFFDILYSVSVVENVPPHMLTDFLIDHDRILKKGGLAVHLVDFYCDSSSSPSGITKRLIDSFKAIDSNFECEIQDWAFQPSFCSNDDLTMWHWNNLVPSLKNVRETNQSCSFMLKIYKV